MSIKHKGQTIAGGYEMTSVGNATEQSAGLVRLATEEETKAGLSNSLAVTPKGYADTRNSMITNCILEIPDRIKLELDTDANTLTLKAGSVVTIPNGFEADGTTPHFDYVPIEQDVSKTGVGFMGSFSNAFTCYNNTLNRLGYNDSFVFRTMHNEGASGDVQPTFSTGNGYWYDTANNVIKCISNSTIVQSGGFSFPLCLMGNTANQMDTINQVFNGMGYIGSTAWVDKDVKVLIPNGRNADGTLKNIEHITPKLRSVTFASDFTRKNGHLVLNTGGSYLSTVVKYDATKNLNIHSDTGADLHVASIAYDVNVTAGVVESLQPYTAFQAVDRNDKQWLSYLSMPSSKVVTLTTGASGSTYTAPANGWLAGQVLNTASAAANTFIELHEITSGSIGSVCITPVASRSMFAAIPLRKGAVASCWYSVPQSALRLTFVYVEGEA